MPEKTGMEKGILFIHGKFSQAQTMKVKTGALHPTPLPDLLNVKGAICIGATS